MMQYSYIPLASISGFILFFFAVYFQGYNFDLSVFDYSFLSICSLWCKTFDTVCYHLDSSLDFFTGGPMRSIFFSIKSMMISLDQWIMIPN